MLATLSKRKNQRKVIFSLKISQKTSKTTPTFRAIALPFFKKETIGGKSLKFASKIPIYNNLYVKGKYWMEKLIKHIAKRYIIEFLKSGGMKEWGGNFFATFLKRVIYRRYDN